MYHMIPCNDLDLYWGCKHSASYFICDDPNVCMAFVVTSSFVVLLFFLFCWRFRSPPNTHNTRQQEMLLLRLFSRLTLSPAPSCKAILPLRAFSSPRKPPKNKLKTHSGISRSLPYQCMFILTNRIQAPKKDSIQQPHTDSRRNDVGMHIWITRNQEGGKEN